MRRAARRDGNHAEIRDGLRAVGCSVYDTGAVGGAFADLVVGRQGCTFLIEIKNPKQPPSKRKLRPGQQALRDTWRGHYAVVETLAEAIAAVGIRLARDSLD